MIISIYTITVALKRAAQEITRTREINEAAKCRPTIHPFCRSRCQSIALK